MKSKGIFLCVFLICLISISAYAYNWPVPVTTSQHLISGTLGEWRSRGGGSFHAGVDIAEPAGTNVYSIFDGEAYKEGDCVIVISNGQKFDYCHITPVSSISSDSRNRTPIRAFQDLLGTIAPIPYPHLHLEESDGGANPLRPDGLIPYNDNANPECIQNSIHIWRETGINTPDDQNPQITNGILSGVIDISARMKDFYTDTNGSSGGGRTGIYEDGGTDKGEIFAPEFSLSYNIKNGGVR